MLECYLVVNSFNSIQIQQFEYHIIYSYFSISANASLFLVALNQILTKRLLSESDTN